MNNLRTHKCLGVDSHNNYDHYAQSQLGYPCVILASKLSLLIFIGLCGPVELLLRPIIVDPSQFV